MIQLANRALEPTIAAGLADYQRKIDLQADYETCKSEGSRLFSSRNRDDDPVFGAIRVVLADMCPPQRSCMYCEDAPAREIDHFYPKSRYPERVFLWDNYLYVCHDCNHDKGTKFAVFLENGDRYDVVSTGTWQPDGRPLLINPRFEDPLDLLEIQLETGYVLPLKGSDVAATDRAEFTIATLKMNRDPLPESRQTAYSNFLIYLASNAPRARNAVRRARQQSVWQEMKRQTQRWLDFPLRRGTEPEFIALFQSLPEALGW